MSVFLSNLFVPLVNAFREWITPPPRPDAVTWSTGAPVVAMQIKVTLTPPKAPDVSSRELTYTINGGPPVVVSLNPANDPPHTFLADVGAVIVGSLVDINAKGFRSAASDSTSFTANDPSPPKPDAPVFEVVAG